MNNKKSKLLPEERRGQIEALIKKNGRVIVDEISSLFRVSKVTARNDLDELERRGVVVRTHGGAVRVDKGELEATFEIRQHVNPDEKSRIGQVAASMVNHGEVIALDGSTTALHMARSIKNHLRLTVVTNSLYVALELDDAPEVTIVVPGGIMRRDTGTLIGELAEQALTKFNIQKMFFGADGITLEEGLTEVNPFEVRLKRFMLPRAGEVIAIVDYSKWGRVGFSSFAAIDEVDKIITDDKAPPELVEAIQRGRTKVILA